MMRRFSFAQRVGVGLSACILAGLVLLITLMFAVGSLVAGNEAGTRESSRAVLEVERLRLTFAEKVAHERGYALSGDGADREARDASRARFLESLAWLRQASLSEDVHARLATLADAEQLHEDGTLEFRLRKASNMTLDELDWWATQHVASARREVERELAALAERIQASVSQRLLLSQEAARGANRLILFTGLVGLLGVGALAFLLRRSLVPLYRSHLQSEKRLRLLMEGVQDYALSFLDGDGRVSGWSAGAERMTGWAREDVDGRGGELLHSEEAVAEGLPKAHRERAAREGRLLSEGWRVRRDGSRFWAETLLTALRDEHGRLQGFAEVMRDMTERRRVERMQGLFAEAGRVLGSTTEPEVLGHALVGLCVPEVADACVLFLPGEDGTVRPSAVVHAEADGERRLWELLLRRPEAGDYGPARVVQTGRSELLPEVELERLPRSLREGPHGEMLGELRVRSCLTVPLTVGPRVLGALCLLSTEPHRRYGAVDLALMEELAARAALAFDNARLLTEAQGALELIGVAAHDLGNPLWSLQLRLRRLRGMADDNTRLRDGLGLAEQETRRLGQLVHNMLDLSRLSAGRLTLDTEELDLSQLAREVAERHAEHAQAAGCTLTVRADTRVPGRWDRLRLDRVVTNLLTNALKFGHGRPVELRVEATPHGARLVVRDSGIGIAPEAQQRIFGRFERVQGAKAHAGFGLGLYIVRQLVEIHGGSIQVRSQLGEGAEFIVDLPRVAMPGRSQAAEARV